MSISSRILPLALGLALVLPASAWAQGRGHARGHEKAPRAERPDVTVRSGDRGSIVLRDGDRTIVLGGDELRRYPVRSDRGPRFCRTGAGHPVHGLDWCLDKGFGIGQPGSWFLRDGDLFLRDRARVIVLRDRAFDADRAFWGAVVGQLLAWAD